MWMYVDQTLSTALRLSPFDIVAGQPEYALFYQEWLRDRPGTPRQPRDSAVAVRCQFLPVRMDRGGR